MSIPRNAIWVALSLSALQAVSTGCRTGVNATVEFRRYSSFEIAQAEPGPVEAHRSKERLAAFVVWSGKEPLRIDLGSIDEIAQRVGAWREAIGVPIEGGAGSGGSRRDSSSELAAGRALREMLLDPVFAAIGDEVSGLVVSPDDVVHLVPLDALPNATKGLVGDHVQLSLVRSSTELASPSPPRQGEPSLLAIGDPAQSVDAEPSALRSASVASPSPASTRSIAFRPLPGAARELEAVGRSFQQAFDEAGVVLLGEAATKAEFAARASTARYLHVATHGWFASEGIDSFAGNRSGNTPVLDAARNLTGFAPSTLCGLAFASANQGSDRFGRVPGILTADELAGLDLESCELAVLAASETNVGVRRAGQGVESLQKALHQAGARAAITSLWKVDDAATCELMERFYEYLWIEELPTAEALWRAKSDLRALGHPTRDWAAWVLSRKAD